MFSEKPRPFPRYEITDFTGFARRFAQLLRTRLRALGYPKAEIPRTGRSLDNPQVITPNTTAEWSDALFSIDACFLFSYLRIRIEIRGKWKAGNVKKRFPYIFRAGKNIWWLLFCGGRDVSSIKAMNIISQTKNYRKMF